MGGIATAVSTRGTEDGTSIVNRGDLATTTSAHPGGVYCHGFGSPSWFEPLGGSQPKLASLVRADFRFIAMEMGGGATWGNSTATGKAGNAVTQLGVIGGRTDRVFVLAQSMGALTALGSILAGTLSTSIIAGMALMIPALDLVDLHDQNRGGYAASIETAHGVSGTYAGNSTIAARNPAAHGSSFTSFPIKVWNGGADPIAVPATVTAFASAVGSNVAVATAAGVVHDATAAAPVSEVLAFALSVS